VTLTALTLAEALGILAVAGGIVVALYILKLRRRRIAVPFIPLWHRVLAEKETTRLFSRLRRLISLLVQLALLALLVFALGDPRLAARARSGRSVVLLVDASASMKATDVSPSRLEKAKAEAKRIVRGLGGADRALVAQLDSEVTPLCPLTDDVPTLLAAIANVRATDAPGDLARGLRLALDVLASEPNPEVVVLSDGAGASEPHDALGLVRPGRVKVRYVPIGRSGRNVGIPAFSARRYPLDKSRVEVLVELRNYGEREESVELRLMGDGDPVAHERVLVGPGESSRRFYPAAGDRRMEAVLALADRKADDLPADDHAYAVLPERRRARVLAVTRGNLYLQAALLMGDYVDLTVATPAEYPPAGRFDAIVFDDWTPPTPPETSALYFHPTGAGSPFEVRGEAEAPWFDQVDRRHPLVRWVSLGDVNVAAAEKLALRPGDRVVAGSPGAPLIVAREGANRRVAALAFDVRRSDLPLRIAFPLFVLNAVDWMTGEDPQYLSSFETGDSWRVPVDAGLSQATIVDPSGERTIVPVVEGRAVYSGTRAGFYRAEAGGKTVEFAANLAAPSESAMKPSPRLTVAGTAAGAVRGFTVGIRREVWVYLLFGAFGILAIEWFTYHRRITV
jgi:hypothetical protein